MSRELNQSRPLYIKLLTSFTSKHYIKREISIILQFISCIQLFLLISALKYEEIDSSEIFDRSQIIRLAQYDNFFSIFLENKPYLALGIFSIFLAYVLFYILFEFFINLKTNRHNAASFIITVSLKLHSTVFFYWIHKFSAEALWEYKLDYVLTAIFTSIIVVNSLIIFSYVSFCFSSINIDGYVCRKTSSHLIMINIVKTAVPIIKFLSSDKIIVIMLYEILMAISFGMMLSILLKSLPEYDNKLNKLYSLIAGACFIITVFNIIGSFSKEPEKFFIVGILLSPISCKFILMSLEKTLNTIITYPTTLHDDYLLLHVPAVFSKLEINFDLNLKKRHIKDPNFLIRGQLFDQKIPRGKETEWFKTWTNSMMKKIFEKTANSKSHSVLKVQEIHHMIFSLKSYLKAYYEANALMHQVSKLSLKLALYILIDEIDIHVEEKKVEKGGHKNEDYIFLLEKDFYRFKSMLESYCKNTEILWKIATSSTIDIAKQNLISNKVTKIAEEIEATWELIEKNHKAQKSFPYLLYGTYLTQFRNMPYKGKKILDKYARMCERFKFKLKDQIFTDSYFTVSVEALPPKMGRIISASTEFINLFGFKKEVTKKNISSIMPKCYKANHDSFLNNFYLTGKSKILHQTQEFLAKSTGGFLIPIEVFVTIDSDNLHGIMYRASIRKIESKYEHIIVNSSGNVDEYTPDIANLLNLSSGFNFADLLPSENKHILRDLIQYASNPKGNFNQPLNPGSLGKIPSTNHISSEIFTKLESLQQARRFNHAKVMIEKGTFLFLRPNLDKSLKSLGYMREIEDIPFHMKIKLEKSSSGFFFVFKLKKLDAEMNSFDFDDVSKADLDLFMNQLYIDERTDYNTTDKIMMTSPIHKHPNGGTLDLMAKISPFARKVEVESTGGSEKTMGEYVGHKSMSRSSLNSQEKLYIMIENVQEIMHEKPQDGRRRAIEVIFGIILLTTLLLSAILYFESEDYLKVIEKGIYIILTSYERLDSILWCWRAMLSYQVRIEKIKPVIQTDFDRIKSVMETNMLIFKVKNEELRNMIGEIEMYRDFFEPVVSLRDRGISGTIETRNHDLFVSGELLVSKMLKYLSLPDTVKIDPLIDESKFILLNIPNDFLIESKHLVELSELNLSTLQDSKIKMFKNIFIAASIIMICSLCTLTWNYLILKRRLEELTDVISTINQDTIDDHLRNVSKFKELIQNEEPEILTNPSIRKKIVKKIEAKAENSKIKSKNRSKIYPFKLLRTLFLVIIFDCTLIGLFALTYTKTLGAVDTFIKYLQELKAISRAGYSTNLAICTNFYQFTNYQDGLIFNKPLALVNSEIFNAIGNNDYLTSVFINENGRYNYEIVETYFTGDFCSLIEDYSFPGRNMTKDCFIATAAHKMGLLEVNTQIYQTSKFLKQLISRNSSFESIQENYHFMDESVIPHSYVLKSSYQEISNFISAKYEAIKKPTYKSLLDSFIAEIHLQIILSIVCIWTLVNVINSDQIYRNIFPLFPAREIFKNKFLKSYLVRLYDYKINYIVNVHVDQSIL